MRTVCVLCVCAESVCECMYTSLCVYACVSGVYCVSAQRESVSACE